MIYIFIGGAYGDDYWQSTAAPEKGQLDSWKCGELVIIKVDSDLRSWKLTNVSGLDWEEVRQATPTKGGDSE